MRTTWVLLTAALGLALACGGVADAPPITSVEVPDEIPVTASGPNEADARSLVTSQYVPYTEGGMRTTDLEKSPLASSGLRKRFAAARAAWNADPEGMGGLDYDPVVNAQDYEITRMKAVVVEASGGARVEARFDNYGQPQVVVWHLVAEDGSWKIDDLSTGEATLGQQLDAIAAGQ